MSFLLWALMILSLCVTAWCLLRHQKRNQRMARLQKALRKAKAQIYNLEEEHLQKELEREATEEKLRGYLQLLDALINNMPNPIYFKDEEGVYQGCNNVFAETILGLKRDQIIARMGIETCQLLWP